MFSVKVKLFTCIIAVLFGLSSCKRKGIFMDEKFADIREECLTENSMTIDDLKSGWHLEEIPKKNLCFHKCMMLKSGLIDADGVIQADKVSELAEQSEKTDEEREEALQCVKALEKIESCEDTHKVFECHNKLD